MADNDNARPPLWELLRSASLAPDSPTPRHRYAKQIHAVAAWLYEPAPPSNQRKATLAWRQRQAIRAALIAEAEAAEKGYR